MRKLALVVSVCGLVCAFMLGAERPVHAFWGLFSSSYKDGTYEGMYEEKSGDTNKVILTIKDGKIVKCVLEARDCEGKIKGSDYGRDGSEQVYKICQRSVRGMNQYPDLLVRHQSMDKFDAISGATRTYKAMDLAVQEALKKAR